MIIIVAKTSTIIFDKVLLYFEKTVLTIENRVILVFNCHHLRHSKCAYTHRIDIILFCFPNAYII